MQEYRHNLLEKLRFPGESYHNSNASVGSDCAATYLYSCPTVLHPNKILSRQIAFISRCWPQDWPQEPLRLCMRQRMGTWEPLSVGLLPNRSACDIVAEQVKAHWQAAAAWVTLLASPTPASPGLTQTQKAAVKRVVFVTILFMSLAFILVWIFWKSEGLRFWLQTFTGNWSPENSENVGGLQFAISVLIGMIINWLPLLAAFVFFSKFIRPVFVTERQEQERTMETMAQAIAVINATNRRSVLSLFPEDNKTRDEIIAALDSSEKRAMETIEKMVGPERAKQIFDAMNRPI